MNPQTQIKHEPQTKQIKHEPSTKQIKHEPQTKQIKHEPPTKQIKHEPQTKQVGVKRNRTLFFSEIVADNTIRTKNRKTCNMTTGTPQR